MFWNVLLVMLQPLTLQFIFIISAVVI